MKSLSAQSVFGTLFGNDRAYVLMRLYIYKIFAPTILLSYCLRKPFYGNYLNE